MKNIKYILSKTFKNIKFNDTFLKKYNLINYY